MKRIFVKNRKLILIFSMIVIGLGTLFILLQVRSDSYYRESTDNEEYILNNGLQLYMDYESILELMGEPDSIDEYSVDGASLYPTHYYFVLNYEGMKISMFYVDKDNTGIVGSLDIAWAEQIQLFGGDCGTSKNITVGQIFKELKKAYGFHDRLKTSEISTDFRIARTWNMEKGEFNKYDSLCCIDTPMSEYEDRETKGLLFLMNSDEITSIVLYNPRAIIMAPKVY